MSKRPYPNQADLNHLMHHARSVVVRLVQDLVHGCRPELAGAFALASLESWRLACRPAKDRDPLERKQLLMHQALQLAVHHYQEPEIVQLIGPEQAEIYRHQFLQILLELTGP